MPSFPLPGRRTALSALTTLAAASWLMAASASATVIEAASLPNGAQVGSGRFEGLSFGSPGATWYTFNYPTSGPVFVLGGGTSGSSSGAHAFIQADEAIQVNRIRVAWVGGNDTVDGWFELFNDGTRVFSGNKDLKDESVYDPNLAFTVGTSIRNVDVTPSAQASTPAYNRVILVFRQANNPPNYAAIPSLDIQAIDPNRTSLGTAIAAVPEPGALPLLLAGMGALGWVVRRRRAA